MSLSNSCCLIINPVCLKVKTVTLYSLGLDTVYSVQNTMCLFRVYTKPGLGHGPGHGPPYGLPYGPPKILQFLEK